MEEKMSFLHANIAYAPTIYSGGETYKLRQRQGGFL